MPAIVARLNVAHPDEVPGIVAIPIVATSADYCEWLLAQTEAHLVP